MAQDDDGFEIRSLADSLDDDDEEDGRRAPSAGNNAQQATNLSTDQTVSSSLPVSRPAAPVAPASRPRESLDGETIFAVGEDGDKWSDDDDSPRNSEERKRLTGGKDL